MRVLIRLEPTTMFHHLLPARAPYARTYTYVTTVTPRTLFNTYTIIYMCGGARMQFHKNVVSVVHNAMHCKRRRRVVLHCCPPLMDVSSLEKQAGRTIELIDQH